MFSADSRVQTVFTAADGSAFDDGLGDYLARIQARVVSWHEAVRTDFDLALSASANGDLDRLKAPLLLMPHGAGHNRLLRTPSGYSSEVSGLARSQLIRHGAVLPAAIALSHDDQLERLARSCPEAVPAAVVTGDPGFDRIVAHLPRRERYRRALGVPPGGSLVLISSTWGEHSLLGTNLGLPARLRRELPLDEFQVALVAHPNVWKRYGGLQVRLWLADAQAAGLTVIPPEQGWQAALIAADVIVGDHGSVTFYGAALDRPVLLASSGGEREELDPDSPTAELTRRLPRLDLHRPLPRQVGHALATRVRGSYHSVTSRMLSHVGSAHENLRHLAYRLMDLPQPATPLIPAPLPEPHGERIEPSAFLAHVHFETGPHAMLRRFPATLTDSEAGNVDLHLVVGEEELDRRLRESAAIIVGHNRPRQWLSTTLEHFPGSAATASIISTRQAWVRLRGRPNAFLVSASETMAGFDPMCLPSIVYGWLLSGRDLPSLIASGLTATVGAEEARIRVTPPPSI